MAKKKNSKLRTSIENLAANIAKQAEAEEDFLTRVNALDKLVKCYNALEKSNDDYGGDLPTEGDEE